MQADVAIVTTTLYPDLDDPVQAVRSRLAASALQAAREAGYAVTCVSDPSMDMFESRQEAVRIALRDDPMFIVWTEPEKDVTPWYPIG